MTKHTGWLNLNVIFILKKQKKQDGSFIHNSTVCFFLDDLSWVDCERTFLSFPLHCWNTVDLAEWRVCTECNNIMLIYNIQWWIYAPKFLVVNTDFLNSVLVWLIVRETNKKKLWINKVKMF